MQYPFFFFKGTNYHYQNNMRTESTINQNATLLGLQRSIKETLNLHVKWYLFSFLE